MTVTRLIIRPALLLLLSAMIVVSGCGVYTFNPKGKASIASISVEPFENKTGEFGLTDRLTDVIIDAFIADGSIKVVPVSSAEAQLVGTLTGYRRVANQFDENDQVQTYKVIMNFDISLVQPQDGTEIWKEAMNEEGIYDAASETEEDGQTRAGQRLVEAILNKTTKSW